MSSPRTWRCFRRRGDPPGRGPVFSTYVEVFLNQMEFYQQAVSLLHVRGGVSQIRL